MDVILPGDYAELVWWKLQFPPGYSEVWELEGRLVWSVPWYGLALYINLYAVALKVVTVCPLPWSGLYRGLCHLAYGEGLSYLLWVLSILQITDRWMDPITLQDITPLERGVREQDALSPNMSAVSTFIISTLWHLFWLQLWQLIFTFLGRGLLSHYNLGVVLCFFFWRKIPVAPSCECETPYHSFPR